jgi:hypothetical protein
MPCPDVRWARARQTCACDAVFRTAGIPVGAFDFVMIRRQVRL